MNELWKEVSDLPGYSVSSIGRIKKVVDGADFFLKLQILKIGYPSFGVYRNGKHKSFMVHRLVAAAFISNPCGYKCVNHKDGNKANNTVENLEWCSHSMNQKHAYEKGLKEAAFKNRKGKDHFRSIPVIVSQLDGTFFRRFESMSLASTELRINVGSIKECCEGKRNRAGKYKFSFEKILHHKN